MLQLVKDFCLSPIHEITDSVLVVIMSHGDDNGIIYGKDTEFITEEQVKQAMTPDSGSKAHLADKPRILIVAACRGSMRLIDLHNSVPTTSHYTVYNVCYT